MKIVFQCNLDEAKRDVCKLNQEVLHGHPVPRKGESVTFSFTKNGRRFSYSLAVVDVSYDYGQAVIIVELHLDAIHSKWSIDQWTQWFKSHRYG